MMHQTKLVTEIKYANVHSDLFCLGSGIMSLPALQFATLITLVMINWCHFSY